MSTRCLLHGLFSKMTDDYSRSNTKVTQSTERKRRKSFNSPPLLMWNMKVLTNWFVFLSSSLLHICQKLKSFPCFSKIKFIQRTGGKEDSSNIVSKIAFTIVYKKEDDISKPRTVSQWFYQQTTTDSSFLEASSTLCSEEN